MNKRKKQTNKIPEGNVIPSYMYVTSSTGVLSSQSENWELPYSIPLSI